METIFFAGGALITLLFFLSQSLTKGVGTVGGALKQIGLFILQKNPPGLVDIFDDRDGSGSRTWMNFGMLWFVFATLLGFLMGGGTTTTQRRSIHWPALVGLMMTARP